MRVCGLGLETPLEVRAGVPAVLEIENSRMFARCCQSLVSGGGEDAAEPYSLWDGEGREIGPTNGFLPVLSPLDLPWDDKAIVGHLHRYVRDRLYEEYKIRESIERLAHEMGGLITQFNMQVEGEYAFDVEWDLMRHLKMLAFRPQHDESESVLDNLIRFLDTCYDVKLNRPLLFITVKPFLSEKDIAELYERIFFLDLEVLLIEPVRDARLFARESKRCIDLHFLES